MDTHTVPADERRGLALVTVAVLFFSTSPVLIRWAAQSVSSFEIAAGRLLIAGILVLGLSVQKREPLVARSEWPRFALFGLVAALHFFFYIYSLEFTTIAHSLAIVYTAPIFTALVSHFMFAEPLTGRKWFGMSVAVVGVAILSGFEPDFSPRMLLGDLLALGSALALAAYALAGRSQRERYTLFGYAGSMYLVAGLWLLPVAAIGYTPGSYNWGTIASIIGLGVFPLAIGHTLYNAALRRVNATYVNLIATQEVFGGVLLGAFLLREIPSLNSISGGLITIAGILIVIL